MTATDTILPKIMGEKWHRKMFDDKKGHQLNEDHHNIYDKSPDLSFTFFLSICCCCVALTLCDLFATTFRLFSLYFQYQYHCMHSSLCFVWSCSALFRQDTSIDTVSVSRWPKQVSPSALGHTVCNFVNRLLTSIIKHFITPGSVRIDRAD